MSGVNGVGPVENQYWDDKKIKEKEEEMELGNVSIFYTTELTEDRRTDFQSSFQTETVDESKQGAKFLQGLEENKEALMEELGLSDSEYDNLACIALALASQETGMGNESGYVGENEGLGKWFRDTLKNIESWIDPSGSESSGLTQVKIYDFMNGKLSDEEIDILYAHGVSAESITSDNLYSSPDKAAVATMVVLNSLANEYYPQYLDKLKTESQELAAKLDPEQLETRGQEVLDSVMSVYENADSKTKEQIRLGLKQWMLSTNGSKDGLFVFDKTYNEEHNLNELNKLLKLDKPIVQEDLDYIRYALSKDGEQMNATQYCAYAWNNGTGTTGMQFDRLLAAKIGTIYTTPEIFDYDQFVYNVETIAKKYALQMSGS